MSQLAILGGSPVRTKAFPAWPVFDQTDEQRLLDTLRSGCWGIQRGNQVSEFEERFASYQQAKYAVGVVNGSVALKIALLAAGIEAGDEVIVPPYTFLATATAVLEVNAVPIFADVDPDTLNLDPKAVERLITPRTRIIIPVHLGGLPADIDAFMALADRHGLTVIEDAAQAVGAQYKGRRVGAVGHMGCFSFQSSKNLTCGEGGAIVTNDKELARRCRSLHDCGRVEGGAWYEHRALGSNYRLTEFQGAILNTQLDRLEAQTQRRDENGRWLHAQLDHVAGITPQKRDFGNTRHAYHLFPLRFDEATYGVSRDTYIKAMHAEGVPLSPGYTVPLYQQPLFMEKNFGPFTSYRNTRPDLDYASVSCPVCEKICGSRGMWLTQSIFVGSADDMKDIAQAFKKLYDCREELPLIEAKAEAVG